MGRLKELRAYVNAELNKMEDEDKRTGAIVHLYGVSLAATMIAKKRGLDWEIAAFSLNDFDDKAPLADVCLLGPQVRYALNKLRTAHPDYLITDIPMQMYGLIRNDHNTVKVANRIFETRLYNLFLSDEELKELIGYMKSAVDEYASLPDDKKQEMKKRA